MTVWRLRIAIPPHWAVRSDRRAHRTYGPERRSGFLAATLL
jgi:hypothetical protein